MQIKSCNRIDGILILMRLDLLQAELSCTTLFLGRSAAS